MHRLASWNEIWVLDSEFSIGPGGQPGPLCVVWHQVRSGRRWVQAGWEQLRGPCPVPNGPDVLFMGYNLAAEWRVYRQLGWPWPKQCLDLYFEHRLASNNLILTYPKPRSLQGALAFRGLKSLTDPDDKARMQTLCASGGPFTLQQRREIVAYCRRDVQDTVNLFRAMLADLDIPRALHRGRYSFAIAAMEGYGIPIDVEIWESLRDRWDEVRQGVISAMDAPYGVCAGVSINPVRLGAWADRHGLPWPCTPRGQPKTDAETFESMADMYPFVRPLQQLQATLGVIRSNRLAVGPDGRNRASLFPFGTLTGRNTPSPSEFIFGPAVWMRGLIRPEPGRALAYIDWSAQEPAIAASLSGDRHMQEDYVTDPYLSFLKRAGRVPQTASKQSHKAQRDQCKGALLGILYGMQESSLGARLGATTAHGREWLRMHQGLYPAFWAWSNAAEAFAASHLYLQTCFGWRAHFGPQCRPFNGRSARNFLIQATGAEMLRLTIGWMVDYGLRVIAPIHDAVMIESELEYLDRDVSIAKEIMVEAGKMVLDGFVLRSDATIVRYPGRYMDGRPGSRENWNLVMWLLFGDDGGGHMVDL